MKGRRHTKADKERFSKIVDIGCIACKRYHAVFSPCAIHHIDGKTKPGAHKKTIGLCGAHHQTGGYGVALHSGKAVFEKKYGTEQELLEYQNELINE